MNRRFKLLTLILSILLVSSMLPTVAAVAETSGSWQDSGIPDTQWYTDQTAAGQGSSGDPYVISTAAQLAGLANLVNGGNLFANKYIKLDANIDLAGREWAPIGTNDTRFYGIFDGDGHIVSNMTIHAESDSAAGLFGYIGQYSGVSGIKNLGVVNADIKGQVRYGGALAGAVFIDGYNKSDVFDKCFATGSISSDLFTAYLGGLYGYVDIAGAQNSSVTFSNSYSDCAISDLSTNNESYLIRYVGGIIGQLENYGLNINCTINDCYSASRISFIVPERVHAGGFIGDVNTTSQISITDCLFDTQAAGIGYGFSSAGVSFDGAAGKMTTEMTGTLPSGWDPSVWQYGSGMYPQLKVFGASADSFVSDSSLASALPIFLFENSTIPELSDTRANVRHNFTVPASGITWSADPSGILAFSGGTALFTSPSSDTEVTVTATLDSGASKVFTVLCKSGVDPGDVTPPTVTIGAIEPSDSSASIPVTSSESATLYVLVRPAADGAPSAGEIITDSATQKGSGTSFSASAVSLQASTDYTAYAVGVDATGNVSTVESIAFTTLQDQTPPAWEGSDSVNLSGSTVSFACHFNEVGTFKYVVLPTNQTAPNKNQVAAGQDAAGSEATHSYSQAYGGGNAAVNIDVSGYAPDRYTAYLVCEDAAGNISEMSGFTNFGFEIKGNATFTVTDGTNPIEGAEVTVGVTSHTTDASGQAAFASLSKDTYSYTVTAAGYSDETGSFTLDAQEKSIPITLTAPVPVALQSAAADGAAGSVTSTKINFTFNTSVTGLTADDITITGGTGSAAKGALTGSGTSWSIAVSDVSEGTVSVAVASPAGYTVSGSPKTVHVYAAAEAPTVTNVKVSPSTAAVQQGGTKSFSATVSGTNSPAQTVTWSVLGANKSGTAISTSGVLSVAADETAATLTVKATSTVNTAKSGTATVTVTAPAGGIPTNIQNGDGSVQLDLSGATFDGGVTDVTTSAEIIPSSGAGSENLAAVQNLLGDNQGLVLYNIQLKDQNGNPIEPTGGTIKVKIKIPDGMSGDLHVYWYDQSAGQLTDMNATQENGYFVFETSHFSLYAITQLGASTPTPTPTSTPAAGPVAENPGIPGLPDSYTMYTGGRVTWTPGRAGGVWHFDQNLLKSTGNGTVTFTALKSGTTSVLYTVGWASKTISVTIRESKLPQTGQDGTWIWILSIAACAALAAGILIGKKKLRTEK